MITCNRPKRKTQSRQEPRASAFTDARDLLDHLNLPQPVEVAADAGFSFLVPTHFASLMKAGDAEDPLLKQVLPSPEEMDVRADYSDDPLQDQSAHLGHGILQKYQGRALLIATGACALHCRYCFRRHFPYAGNSLTQRQLQQAARLIADSPDISEVILSGGDPLTLSPERLSAIVKALEAIPTVKRIRFHSRVPVVQPELVTQTVIDCLSPSRMTSILVLHVNHPQEISPGLQSLCVELRARNLTLLNQAVLLKGINDKADIQVSLSENLFSIGVLPYYLHQLDKVSGAAHFAVEEKQAVAMYQEMRARLPGYLLPRFVLEVPGAASKMPVSD